MGSSGLGVGREYSGFKEEAGLSLGLYPQGPNASTLLDPGWVENHGQGRGTTPNTWAADPGAGSSCLAQGAAALVFGPNSHSQTAHNLRRLLGL